MTVPEVAFGTSEIAGVPIFPPTNVFKPLPFERISPIKVVVVVFPFDPVIATMSPWRNFDASSISPITGWPNALAWMMGSASMGTPGLMTIRSWLWNVRSPWPPVSTVIPSSSSAGISWRRWSSDFASETVTWAPWAFKNRAEATPERPNPTTSTRLPLNSIRPFSPQRHRVTEASSFVFSVALYRRPEN